MEELHVHVERSFGKRKQKYKDIKKDIKIDKFFILHGIIVNIVWYLFLDIYRLVYLL